MESDNAINPYEERYKKRGHFSFSITKADGKKVAVQTQVCGYAGEGSDVIANRVGRNAEFEVSAHALDVLLEKGDKVIVNPAKGNEGDQIVEACTSAVKLVQ